MFVKQFEVSVGWKDAGLLTLYSWRPGSEWAFHLFPEREFWVWGIVKDSYYDGPLGDIGVGPLFRATWRRG